MGQNTVYVYDRNLPHALVVMSLHFQILATSSREKCVYAGHTMAQATFRIGEKVLCYETDPGKVNKLYPAVVNQVIIVIVLKMLNLKLNTG